MKKPLGSLQGHFYTNSNLNIKETFVALFLSRKLNRHCAVFLFLFCPSLSVIQRHRGLSCRPLDSDAEGCGFAFYPWPVAGKTPSLHFTQHKNFPYRVESLAYQQVLMCLSLFVPISGPLGVGSLTQKIGYSNQCPTYGWT